MLRTPAPLIGALGGTNMSLDNFVKFWKKQTRTPSGWCHPDDAPILAQERHSFNLDYPVGPFVGNLIGARVLILGANAGYNPLTTPVEFETQTAIEMYLSRITSPATANWSSLAPYYGAVNYGKWLLDGRAALVNACAYRSRKISDEPENKRLIEKLPSCRFTRQWLESEVVPLAKRGHILVVAKRPGLWNISHLRGEEGFLFDPAPVSPQIAHKVLDLIEKHLK